MAEDFDAYRYYGTLPRAMFTLFETCLEPLNIRPVVEDMPIMMLFYTLFIFMTTFGLLNVIIGVIVENTMNASRGQKETAERIAVDQKVEALNEIRRACFEFDTS